MMADNYYPRPPNSDDHYLDLSNGKTFLFDRITLASDFAKRADLFNAECVDHCFDDAEIAEKRYFVWRDIITSSGPDDQLMRIMPNPTEIFNGPYYQLPCGWDKIVSSNGEL